MTVSALSDSQDGVFVLTCSNSNLFLLLQVWPALAVLGGIDEGLRVGGRCIHTQTGRKGVLLGVLKPNAAMAKVQWDDLEAAVR